MTEQDLIIQDLLRENEALRAELDWKQKEIELARRHEMQWISVKDRLPEPCGNSDYVKCLAYLPYCDVIRIMEYSFGENCWQLGGFEATVSYWILLPEVPEEGSNGQT